MKETLVASLMNMRKQSLVTPILTKFMRNLEQNSIYFQTILIQTELSKEGCLVFPVLKENVTDLPKLSCYFFLSNVRVRDRFLYPCQLT